MFRTIVFFAAVLLIPVAVNECNDRSCPSGGACDDCQVSISEVGQTSTPEGNCIVEFSVDVTCSGGEHCQNDVQIDCDSNDGFVGITCAE